MNLDCSDRPVDRLVERLELIHRQSGAPVSLVGHSRGGHFAKALATRPPELVARVISMGAGLDTPFDFILPTKAALAAVRAAHTRTTDRVNRNTAP
jgi:triacylglycerol lipase